MEIVKPISATGFNTLSYAYDGTDCRMGIVGGVQGRTTPVIEAYQSCLSPDFDNVVLIAASFRNEWTLPLTVSWDDGVTLSSTAGDPIWRVIQPLQNTTTYKVVSAHDAYCSAVLNVLPAVTVYASPIPDFSLGIGNICTGQTATASLATPPPAGATVHWYGENATIVSGQGTSSIQYKAGDAGTMLLGCTFTFPDAARCPTAHRQAVAVNGDPDATMSLAKPQIHAGETVIITFTMNSNVHYWTFDNSLGDSIALSGNCGANNSPCQAIYTSSHGTGKSTITLHATGFCPETKDVSVDLNIVP